MHSTSKVQLHHGTPNRNDTLQLASSGRPTLIINIPREVDHYQGSPPKATYSSEECEGKRAYSMSSSKLLAGAYLIPCSKMAKGMHYQGTAAHYSAPMRRWLAVHNFDSERPCSSGHMPPRRPWILSQTLFQYHVFPTPGMPRHGICLVQ